jgi:hypothetical protein
MATIARSIDVAVPVRTAYNQWTQFEDFPRFMGGVKEVRQLEDQRLYWRAVIGGKEEAWGAVVTEQAPDECVAWRSTSGAENAGLVTFRPLSDRQTRVHLLLTYTPEGVVEQAGAALGLVTRRVEGDLERFKAFIESRGAETGAWRGEIHHERVEPVAGPAAPAGLPPAAAAARHDQERAEADATAQQHQERDEVTTAAAESMAASDPPSWMAGTAVATPDDGRSRRPGRAARAAPDGGEAQDRT